MNKLKTIAALVALSVSFGVNAQTCGNEAPFNTPSSGPAASGDTCGASDAVSLFCGGQDSSGKNEVIYRVVLAAEGSAERTATNITISGSGTSFTPSLYLYSGACASGDGCVQTGEAGAPLSLAGVNAGTYILAVGASQVDPAGGCGTYDIVANGTLPVTLRSFTIE